MNNHGSEVKFHDGGGRPADTRPPFGNTGDHIPGPVVVALQEELDHINILAHPDVLRSDKVDHGVEGQIVVLTSYARALQDAWTYNRGDETSLNIFRKIAGIAIRALILYGCPRRQVCVDLQQVNDPLETPSVSFMPAKDLREMRDACAQLHELLRDGFTKENISWIVAVMRCVERMGRLVGTGTVVSCKENGDGH